jgi:4-diphosphocytidyl-2-C-methyl-D-erythritol kinase
LTWEKGRDDLYPGDFSTDESNLILRAVRKFENAIGARLDVSIHITKSIPISAGLGGGSSDAAATLVGLSRLYPEFASGADLLPLAAEIGSDVPFFLGPPAAIGRGRGELLTPVTFDVSWYAILICPNVSSPTPAVYAALDLTCLPKMPHFPVRLEGDGFFTALALIHNDLQDVVERRVPQVLHWKNRLLTLGAEGAYVSGSGPSVFGVFRDKPDSSGLDAIRAEGVAAFVVHPLDTTSSMVIG